MYLYNPEMWFVELLFMLTVPNIFYQVWDGPEIVVLI